VLFDATGEFLPEETNAALGAELRRRQHAVIPGFYGSMPDGSIKTFSRGGSDITGAIVARAVGADIYENWTDVSGFLMTDPRIVTNPRPIPAITYREQRELSAMGASVLHEDAVTPVRISRIPINIRNTNAPDDFGTFITDSVFDDGAETDIKGIAGKRGYISVSLQTAALRKEALLSTLTRIASKYDLQMEHLLNCVDSVSFILPGSTPEESLNKAFSEIKQTIAPVVEIQKNLALLAVVGNNVASDPGVLASLFAALSAAGIQVRIADIGSSATCVIVGIDDTAYEAAIRSLYDAFA